MLKFKNLGELKKEHEGKYLQLGGKGLIDGMKCKPTKFSTYTILEVLDDRIRVRKYRKKNTGYIPHFHFDQEAIVWEYKEYKNFPVYG